MKPTTRLYILFVVSICLSVLVSAGFQTTLWFQVFGATPSPMIWLLFMLYLWIYRTPLEAISLSYLLAFIVSQFGYLPFGLFSFNILFLYSLTYFIKERVFWDGPRYFFYASIVAGFMFHIFYLASSLFAESIPVSSWNVQGRIGQSLITPVFAYLIYTFMDWLEKTTHQKAIPESEEGYL